MAELDLNDVAMFVRVIEHAGFAKASRVLGVPTSTVSRAVSRLEEAAGALLVHRNTRNVRATSEGQSFYREVAPLVVALGRPIDEKVFVRRLRDEPRVDRQNVAVFADLVFDILVVFHDVAVRVDCEFRHCDCSPERFF